MFCQLVEMQPGEIYHPQIRLFHNYNSVAAIFSSTRPAEITDSEF